MSFNKETGMYEGYIYLVENIINHKKYIGQTTRTSYLRFKQHIKDSKKRDCYFHRAINKYGKDNFKLSTIFKCESMDLNDVKNELNTKEIYYIDLYNTYNPNGYNSTYGGEGVLGQPCILYDYDGNVIGEFLSVTDAGDKLNLSIGTIWNCCNGIHSGTKVGVFRYKGDSFAKYNVVYRPDFKLPIKIYNYQGDLLEKYESLQSFATVMNTTKTTVGRWLKSHKYIDYKFVIFSAYEDFDKNKISLPENRYVDMYKDDVFIRTFKSASDAARCIGGDSSSISKCILGKMKTHKGYNFKRHNFYENDTLIA